MSERVGGLPPSDYGGEEYQSKVKRLHRLIDRLFPYFGTYHRARQEAIIQQGLPEPQVNNEKEPPINTG